MFNEMARNFFGRFFNLRKLKKILLGIFLSLIIAVALLTALVATSNGSHWLVRSVAHVAHLELGDMQGNLLTGLDISSLAYEKDEFNLQADHISFRWQPLGLFYTALSVQSLAADNIRIHLPVNKKRPESENYQWPSLAQPLRMELNYVDLRNVQVWQGEQKIALKKISGNFSVGVFQLRAQHFVLEHEQAHVDINGVVALHYPYAMNVKSEWVFKAQPETQIIFSGKAVLSGDIKNLKAQNQLLTPLQMNTTASISPALHQPKKLPTVDVLNEWPEQPVPEPLRRYFSANKILTAFKPINIFQGKQHVSGWLNQFALSHHLQAKTADATWLLDSDVRGSYSGALNEWQAQIEQLTLQTQPFSTPGETTNNISISGKLAENKLLHWNLNVAAKKVNMDSFIDNWPSNFSITFGMQGSIPISNQTLNDAKLEFAFNHIQGQGELRGLAVSAQGDIRYEGEHWYSPNANFTIGANQLRLKGQVGQTLAMDWDISAPLLGQIDPDVRGSIISQGTISGDVVKPRIQLNAHINQFAWRNYALENLLLKLNPQNNSDNYDLLLNLDHLQWQSQHISHATIKGGGSLAHHTLMGSVDSFDWGSLQFALNSSWQDSLWHGQWRELSLAAKKIPRWYLSSSTAMQAQKENADFGRVCLTTDVAGSIKSQLAVTDDMASRTTISPHFLNNLSGDSTQLSPIVEQEFPQICIHSQWNSVAGIQLNSVASAIPLQQLHAWFKPEVVLKGVVDAQLDLRAAPTKPLALDAHLQTRGAQLLYQFQGENTTTYSLQTGQWDASIKNNILTTSLLMNWGKYGVINADAKSNLGDKKLQGKVVAQFNDLAPLESLLPFLNDVQGSATANFMLGGKWDKPDIIANLELTNASAKLPRLGLQLKDIGLQVHSQGASAIHVESQITSGDGTLMLRGDLDDFGTPNWHWRSNIYGANIRIIEQPQLIATVSPNLQLAASSSAIHLTGSTEIPWARAALKTLPASATRVSDDVTVIENNNSVSSVAGKQSIPFYTNVILYFGDDVRFKGFGLDSQLMGRVNLLKEENRQLFTTGFVAVGKGNYKAYGQDLTIERGRLIFQGPYDNPGLDIRALRVMDNVTAGLDIGGTLQRPKSSVFSIPASSDSEAMAMLLTGKALSQSSQADAYSLIGAISSLGMDKGQMMTADITRLFRIDEIAIKSDKGLEQSALWIGKYITPKLFIRYMVGLFDQAFTVGMRYQLNDKVRLEAESGKTQSVDVIYKIER